MAFKASFKFSDSREFDVLTWRVKFNRDVDPKGRPHIQDRIKNGEYTYIINTTSGRRAIEDSRVIRRSALQYKVHYDTTLNGGFATAMALNADATEKVISVQEMHAQIK